MEGIKTSEEKKSASGMAVKILVSVCFLSGLYLTTRVNYLLFHVVAEIFSIVIAFSLYVISWNSRQYIKKQFFLILGIAYLFIAFIDLLHTLSYTGMGIFPQQHFYANQLWIAGRFMESLTLLISLFWFRDRIEKSEYPLFLFYLVITGVIVYTIFVSHIFPVCFIPGIGQTRFKIISEYFIIAFLICAYLLLRFRKKQFDRKVFLYIQISIGMTILSEFAFTQYVSNYGSANLIGHFLKIFSFYYIYRSIIKTSITKPFDLIFLEVDELNARLNRELELKTAKEIENEKLIKELKEALENVKELKGLLPVCSSCRKVRDDDGYWENLDIYISKYTDTSISHSLCPDCVKKLYPELQEKILKMQKHRKEDED